MQKKSTKSCVTVAAAVESISMEETQFGEDHELQTTRSNCLQRIICSDFPIVEWKEISYHLNIKNLVIFTVALVLVCPNIWVPENEGSPYKMAVIHSRWMSTLKSHLVLFQIHWDGVWRQNYNCHCTNTYCPHCIYKVYIHMIIIIHFSSVYPSKRTLHKYHVVIYLFYLFFWRSQDKTLLCIIHLMIYFEQNVVPVLVDYCLLLQRP